MPRRETANPSQELSISESGDYYTRLLESVNFKSFDNTELCL